MRMWARSGWEYGAGLVPTHSAIEYLLAWSLQFWESPLFTVAWEISWWEKEIDLPAPTQDTTHSFHAWWERDPDSWRARPTHALNYNRGPPLCLWRSVVSQQTKRRHWDCLKETAKDKVFCISLTLVLFLALWTRIPAFSFCTGIHKLCNQPWAWLLSFKYGFTFNTFYCVLGNNNKCPDLPKLLRVSSLPL